jgi:hypothetical protein
MDPNKPIILGTIQLYLPTPHPDNLGRVTLSLTPTGQIHLQAKWWDQDGLIYQEQINNYYYDPDTQQYTPLHSPTHHSRPLQHFHNYNTIHAWVQDQLEQTLGTPLTDQ